MPQTVLLTGHRKSGTTLLHRLFDGHPDCITYPTDLGLLYAYLPCFAQDAGQPEIQRERIHFVLERALSEFDGMELGPAAGSPLCVQSFISTMQECLQDDDLLDRGRVLSATIEAFGLSVGARTDALIVLKETSQAIYFEQLRLNAPALKVLGIVRDPRDNFAAIAEGVDSHYARLGEGQLEALASMINRARMDLLALSASVNTSDSVSAVRFEDLSAEPEPTMQDTAEWLGIEFKELLVRPTRSGAEFSGNNHGGKKFSGISSEHVGSWRQRLDEFEIGVIEFWLADAMALWGYQTQLSSDTAQAHFSRFYDWYNCQYFYRGTAFDI